MTHRDVDAMVLGGGLAGNMVALELARAGMQPTLLERSKVAHHKMCGEFLSGEAMHYLDRHGVSVASLGGVALGSVRLVFGTAVTECALPFAAYSLTRSVLDEDLLRRAALAGADVQRDSHIERLQQAGGTWEASLRDGRSFCSRNAFLATGKHDLRGWPRPAGKHRGLVAFKMYYALTPQQHAALGPAIELILFEGGYAGLQPVEAGRVNLCLLVTKKAFQAAGSNWTSFLSHLLQKAPHLQTRLSGATPLLQNPLAASHIPYGHMQSSAQDGLWRVGDQAAVIPSFCGDGMAIALHSGALAAHDFLRGEGADTYQRRLSAQLGRRLLGATRLSQLLVAVPRVSNIVRFAPGLLARIASLTRIPEAALLTDSLPAE